MKKSVGFIGGGRITKILLQAFCNKDVKFSNVVVTDPKPEVTSGLKQMFPFIKVEGISGAAAQDIVFIALHPPVIMEALDTVSESVRSDTTVISLAPKITIAKMQSKLVDVKNVVRLIPNATSYINDGYNPVSFSETFDSADKTHIFDLLKNLGHTFEVPEVKLEGYAIISAMLPTYFWFQWKYMEEIGMKTGLTATESENAVHQTLLAAVNLMYNSELKPEEVIDFIPVKPIGEHEAQISEIYMNKLIGLYEKIKP